MFTWESMKIELKGDLSLSLLESSFKALVKATEEKEGYWLEMELRDLLEDQGANEIPPEVVEMLIEFEGLFGEPRGLMPKRALHHAITLINGTQPQTCDPICFPTTKKKRLKGLCRR